METQSLHATPPPAISQLPTELLIQVLDWALPSTDLVSSDVRLHSYMRILYALRLVVKRWQEIIDGTPTFWTLVLSTLPPHVNDTIILRSNNGPLAIVYSTTTGTFGDEYIRPRDFLRGIAHTYPRWSAYRGPVVREYLETPAPLLRYISLYGRYNDVPGGYSTGHLLDFLHASPCLEHLELVFVNVDISNTDHPLAITLPRLRWIEFRGCGDDVVEAILYRIRAPSCTNFRLTIHDMEERDVGKLLYRTLQHFHGTFHAIHQHVGRSEIIFDDYSFQWTSSARRADDHQFALSIAAVFPTTCIRWVEQILHHDSGLIIHFGDEADTSDAVLETIAPMRCVTKIQIGGNVGREDTLRILRFLGELRCTEPSLPSLPGLRELRLTSVGWDAQDLIDMVCSRFDKLPGDIIERSLLSITMVQGASTRPRHPRPILEYTMLTKLRSTNGVMSVRFLDTGEPCGMLGVTWDEGEA